MFLNNENSLLAIKEEKNNLIINSNNICSIYVALKKKIHPRIVEILPVHTAIEIAHFQKINSKISCNYHENAKITFKKYLRYIFF